MCLDEISLLHPETQIQIWGLELDSGYTAIIPLPAYHNSVYSLESCVRSLSEVCRCLFVALASFPSHPRIHVYRVLQRHLHILLPILSIIRFIFNCSWCLNIARVDVSGGSQRRGLSWSYFEQSSRVLAMGPNPRFVSGSGLEPNWNHCNGFYRIKKPNHTAPEVFWPVPQFGKLRTLAAIKYSSSDRITIWYIRKRCSFACSFTTCSPLCDPINIRWVAVK